MDIVGHRGACGHAPENTLKSFRKAIELRCQLAELDVHLSKDGLPVVIRDSNVEPQPTDSPLPSPASGRG